MRISLLGAVKFENSNRTITSFRSSRVPALLGYLLAHPGLASREQVAAALWPDDDHERSRHNLRQTWLYLRQALEPCADEVLLSNRSHIGLKPESLESDVSDVIASDLPAEFERKAEICRKAVASYRGPFLQGMDLDWVKDVRSRLANLYYRALIFLADATLNDSPSESLKFAEMAVEEEPLQDGARARKIRAMMKLGEKAAAQLEYEAFARLLDEELGMTPADIVLEALDGAPVKAEPPARIDDRATTANDLQFALKSLQAGDRPQYAVDLAIALTPHWINVGTPGLGLASLEQAVEKAGRSLIGDKADRAELCRAQLLFARGDLNSATGIIDKMLERKGKLDKALLGQVQLVQCHVSISNAQGKRLVSQAEEAFASAQSLDKSLQLDALLSLSITAISEGRGKAGLEYANRALEIGTELGEMTAIASALVRKAFALETLNRPAESERFARRAWKLLSGMSSARATSLRIDLSRLMEDLGRLSEAEKGYRQCVEECRLIESKFREMVVMTYLADILESRGHAQEAAEIHGKVLEQRRKLDQKPGMATSLRGLGKALSYLGKFDDAREALAESAHIHLNMEHQPGYSSVVAEMAKLEARAGNMQLALRLATRASQLLRGLTDAEKKRIGRSGFTLLGEMETLIQSNTATG